MEIEENRKLDQNLLEDQSSANNPKNIDENNHEEEAFNYDVILNYIGQMGRYQRTTCLGLCLPVMFSAVVVLSFSFTGGIPHYRCMVQGCGNDTDFSWSNYSSEHDMKDGCYRYNLTVTDPILHCDPHNISSIEPALLDKCDQWMYDTSTFESTIFTEFNLPCDNEWKTSLSGTMYMVGVFVGGFAFSNLADVIGRRYALTITVFCECVTMTAAAFAPNLLAFNIIRFFCGVFNISNFIISFVWGVEVVDKKYRTVVGFFYQIVYTVGACILGLVAYYIRDWRTFQLTISLPFFILVVIIWSLPESTRWLITKKRYSEARTSILRAAEANNKHVPAHLLIAPKDSKNEEEDEPLADMHTNKIEVQPSENFLNIIRSPSLCTRLIILFLVWLSVTMTYWGLIFSLGNLSGSFYLNYQLTSLVEIPGYIIGLYAMDKIGRRITVSCSMLLSGIACLAAGIVPSDTVVIALSLLGKLSISCCFGSIFSYTSELFPTTARGAAIGLCSTFGRIGGIMAPIIANMGRNVSPVLPFTIFAAFCISVAILSFTLPETNNVTLPSNIQEATALTTNWNFFSNCRKGDSTETQRSNKSSSF